MSTQKSKVLVFCSNSFALSQAMFSLTHKPGNWNQQKNSTRTREFSIVFLLLSSLFSSLSFQIKKKNSSDWIDNWWLIVVWSVHAGTIARGSSTTTASALAVHVHQAAQIVFGSLDDLHLTDVDVSQWVDIAAVLLDVLSNWIWDPIWGENEKKPESVQVLSNQDQKGELMRKKCAFQSKEVNHLSPEAKLASSRMKH